MKKSKYSSSSRKHHHVSREMDSASISHSFSVSIDQSSRSRHLCIKATQTDLMMPIAPTCPLCGVDKTFPLAAHHAEHRSQPNEDSRDPHNESSKKHTGKTYRKRSNTNGCLPQSESLHLSVTESLHLSVTESLHLSHTDSLHLSRAQWTHANKSTQSSASRVHQKRYDCRDCVKRGISRDETLMACKLLAELNRKSASDIAKVKTAVDDLNGLVSKSHRSKGSNSSSTGREYSYSPKLGSYKDNQEDEEEDDEEDIINLNLPSLGLSSPSEMSSSSSGPSVSSVSGRTYNVRTISHKSSSSQTSDSLRITKSDIIRCHVSEPILARLEQMHSKNTKEYLDLMRQIRNIPNMMEKIYKNTN